MKAGFVGLGAMGAPMAGHLRAAGLLAVVANRTPAKAEAFVAGDGDVQAARAADAFAACDVVALCVSMDADVLQVVASRCRPTRSNDRRRRCPASSARTC